MSPGEPERGVLKWTPYSGNRIPTKGHRTHVDDPPLMRFAESRRRYGCVWQSDDQYVGYYEVEHPGETEDVEVGPFATEREVRVAVEAALEAGSRR